MSTWYPLIKWLHILSSTVLFGTGSGIAFFFLRSQRTGNTTVIAAVARDVVVADLVFTLTAVILQPLTGLLLAIRAGYPLSASWLVWSMVVYVFVGCCWLPVVWLQVQMRGLAASAAAERRLLPEVYHRYFQWWCALGWPAFAGVLIVFYLMVAKPGM